ncbi:hypothetical protein [Enhydrobacter sp.]|jgi:hypothetical protein|uniref:hypothetical protein n=1 Tax=Enhydrobacter sp. TaxID=1894999 RepID=UPI0026229A87|nr:hypothetical protein [Enhydrobacter sp.]
MNRIALAILGSLLAAGCATQAEPQKTSLQPDAKHIRLCDQRVAYAIKPSDAARPEDRPYYGIWKGDVMLGGSSGTMCVAMVVQDIRQGKADNWWVWNLGDGQDMTNFQGMGVANWWGRMEGGRMFLDSDQPYLDNLYGFEFGPPDARGEIRGKFKVESTDRARKAAYPVVLYRYPTPAPTAAPSVAAK